MHQLVKPIALTSQNQNLKCKKDSVVSSTVVVVDHVKNLLGMLDASVSSLVGTLLHVMKI